MYISPTAISMLISERGYDDTGRKIIDKPARIKLQAPAGKESSRTTQDEKVRIPRWGKQDVYRTYDPLNEQSGHWSVERPIARKE